MCVCGRGGRRLLVRNVCLYVGRRLLVRNVCFVCVVV